MSHAMWSVFATAAPLEQEPLTTRRADDAEVEYDRLRDLARAEASSPPTALRAPRTPTLLLSEEGKAHAAKMAAYNKQASEFIFRENNADGKVPADTIDLHGQLVEEPEDIVEERIKYARSTGQTHLHVIVGKGNHSPGHIQKIKPRVEKVCQELGLQYNTEPNEGVLYVNLQGGAPRPAAAGAPSGGQGGYQGGQGGYQGGQGAYPGGGQQQHGGQQQGGQGQQQHGGQGEIEKLALKMLPKVLAKLEKACCVMM
ncbi:hypothetical protein VE04_05384 [Pseudogymnoascus sp. 24MN13]|nr:hypothetical protein VE04_05384 [Pseudogymnoascus sp. 24MN13]